MAHDGKNTANLGMHIGRRLVEIGCNAMFAVPGDFNLLLLDQLLKEPELKAVWCCNELNAGYAADGYARKKGVGCACITFTVGGLSIINAIAGAYSEDLPVICISGGPNSNDFSANHTLHHTTGEANFDQQLRCFKEVTCHQVVINHIEEAHTLIDEAISAAMLKKKPVYIEVSCNLADLVHPSFEDLPVPYALAHKVSNPESLKAAVEAAAKVLTAAVKPTLLAGVRLRHGRSRKTFVELANSSHYPVAILPDAKGMFPESHERFMGLYWGAASTPVVCEILESADIVLTAGAVWTDYTSVGYSLLLHPSKVIAVKENRVTICNGRTFGCVRMDDFLEALAEKLRPTPNDKGFVNFKRMYVPISQPPPQLEGEPLRTNVLFKHIQQFLTDDSAVISEVGDSWFNTQKLRLPDGCGYEMQMRYGSIGWSVGALLGYQFACGRDKRVLACIGDGSFQMTAQEVSTIIRYGLNPIIILINNGGYTIEVEIHDGPYNVIKNWNYLGLAKAFHNGEGKLWTAKATTEAELEEALEGANDHPDDLVFIEVVVHTNDCSKELLEWGSRVASANARKPNPK